MEKEIESLYLAIKNILNKYVTDLSPNIDKEAVWILINNPGGLLFNCFTRFFITVDRVDKFYHEETNVDETNDTKVSESNSDGRLLFLNCDSFIRLIALRLLPLLLNSSFCIEFHKFMMGSNNDESNYDYALSLYELSFFAKSFRIIPKNWGLIESTWEWLVTSLLITKRLVSRWSKQKILLNRSPEGPYPESYPLIEEFNQFSLQDSRSESSDSDTSFWHRCGGNSSPPNPDITAALICLLKCTTRKNSGKPNKWGYDSSLHSGLVSTLAIESENATPLGSNEISTHSCGIFDYNEAIYTRVIRASNKDENYTKSADRFLLELKH